MAPRHIGGGRWVRLAAGALLVALSMSFDAGLSEASPGVADSGSARTRTRPAQGAPGEDDDTTSTPRTFGPRATNGPPRTFAPDSTTAPPTTDELPRSSDLSGTEPQGSAEAGDDGDGVAGPIVIAPFVMALLLACGAIAYWWQKRPEKAAVPRAAVPAQLTQYRASSEDDGFKPGWLTPPLAPEAGSDWYLGIDYGTTSSAAAVVNGRGLFHLEIEGHRRLSSMVLRDADGSLLVGSAAENQTAIYPDRIELTPKRHLGRGAPLLLGGSPVRVTDAVAQVLRALGDEACRQHSGQAPSRVAITHPVRWEERRKQELRAAAGAAGLPDPVLFAEPVAAAITYLDDRIPDGGLVAVYDLGGGTFDTAVLCRAGPWFEIVGPPGGHETIGGEEFDHRVVRFFTQALQSIDAGVCEQIATSEDRRWRRAAADLKMQSRRAKEALSSYPTAQVFVADADADLRITRPEFEAMIADDVDFTVDELAVTIAAAGAQVNDLSAIYLVGGSARIPLVAERMSHRFGSLVTTRDDPKTVTALGAARHAERVGPSRA